MFNWFAPKVFNQGYLPEEDGHQVFFMEAGSKDGKPGLVFHDAELADPGALLNGDVPAALPAFVMRRLSTAANSGSSFLTSAGAVVRSRREKPRTTPPPTFCTTPPVCSIFWI